MACTHCGEDRFGNGAQLQCHVAKNHATFSCNCNKKFMTEKDLLEHKESKKLSEKEFACTVCCRSFDRETDLWNHKRDTKHWKQNERNEMRDSLGIYPCDDRCGRIFISEKGLNDHKRDKAGIFADKEKTCTACAKTFGSSDRLIQHRRDTGHSRKSSLRRKEYIDTQYKRDVALSKHDKQESVKTVDNVLGEMMDYVTKAVGGHIYDHNVRKAGSYPIKTKIGKADEFDVQILVKTTPTETKTRGKVPYRYNKIDPKELDNIYDEHFRVCVGTESHECSVEEESLSTSEMSDGSGDKSSMATDTARLAQHIGSMSQDSQSSDGQLMTRSQWSCVGNAHVVRNVLK